MSTASVSVFVAKKPNEKTAAHELVRRVYAHKYQTSPVPAEVYVCAQRGNILVACIGLDYADADGFFPIERVYGLDRAGYVLPVTAQNTVQFGRLACIEAGAVPLVMHASLLFAQREDRAYGLADHEPAMHRLALKYGIAFRELRYTGVHIDATRPEDAAYFLGGKGRPYLVHIGESLKQ